MDLDYSSMVSEEFPKENVNALDLHSMKAMHPLHLDRKYDPLRLHD